MLIILISIPIINLLYILLNSKITKEEILYISLFSSILSLIQILIIFENYDVTISRFQFISFYGLIGIDSISLLLIWLINILLPIIILNLYPKELNKNQIILFILLSLFCTIVFLVLDLILFYIFYEILLIPMLYLIGYYGSRNRKIQAIYEFYIYTLIGSLFLLMSFIILFLESGTTSYEIITTLQIQPNKQLFLCLGIFLGFAVKVPMIPIHLWLPEAHVEASTSISIYLAAILLKLGTFGILRYILPLFPIGIQKLQSIILTLAIIGIIYTSITCLTLWDIKKFIAYSSISHMNLSLLGLFSQNYIGISSSIYFMISHGIISSGLFLLVGILYDRYHTRILLYYRGLVLILPLYILILGIFTFANIAFPLTSGFISEILTFLSLIHFNPFITILASLAIILTPMYALFFFHQISYGKFSPHLFPHLDLTRKEFAILLPLIFFVIFLGIYPNLIFNLILFNSLTYLS